MESVRVATFTGPGSKPKIETVGEPAVPANAALIEIEACGVCGTDLHILKGHWPGELPWPFTLGHELAGTVLKIGECLTKDFMGVPLNEGCRVMLPPLMPCGCCFYCVHYPQHSNRCLQPTYYGRYLPFEKPPHLWGGWAEMVYVDLDMLPATKIYRLPDNMSAIMGSLSEPLTSCVRALSRAQSAGGFAVGDKVVVQGSGPIGVLMLVAAQEMGAGQVYVIGAPEKPRLELCRKFGAAGTVDIEENGPATKRIAAIRDMVGGFGADLVVDCSGHPSAGPEGLEMLRDGGTYVEMGQFTDAGSIETNWHRICSKDVAIVGSWAFTANDIPLAIDMLERATNRYPWSQLQSCFEFSETGIQGAIEAAMEMRCVKATILPNQS